MLYYTKRLNGTAEQGGGEDMLATWAIFHSQPEDAWSAQGPSQDTDQPSPDTEEEEEGDEGEQPTLAAILKAVHRCTVPVHTLQEHFGGLKKEHKTRPAENQRTHYSCRRPH